MPQPVWPRHITQRTYSLSLYVRAPAERTERLAIQCAPRREMARGALSIQGGPKKRRQIFLAITLVNMDRF